MSSIRIMFRASCMLALLTLSQGMFAQDHNVSTNLDPNEAGKSALAAPGCADVFLANVDGFYFYSKILCETDGENCRRMPTSGTLVFTQPVTTGCIKPTGEPCKCADELVPIADLDNLEAATPITVRAGDRLLIQSYPAEEGHPNVSVGWNTKFVATANGEKFYRLLTLSLTVNGARTDFKPMAIQLTDTPKTVTAPVAAVSETDLKWNGSTYRILSK